MIIGSGKLSKLGFETSTIRQLILRRRLQILIHSYIYYEANTNIISDQTFDQWSKELVELQRDYPKISEKVDYYQEFKSFDGSSGYNLPYNYPEIVEKVNFILYKSPKVLYIGNVLKNNKNPRRDRKMAKKAKWLEEGTDLDLLNVIQEALDSGEKKDITRAAKAVEELIERIPADGEEADVAELITSAVGILETAAENYNNEAGAVGDSSEEDEDDEDSEEEDGEDLDEKTTKELKAIAKELGIKIKGKKKDDLIEAILEAQEDEEDEDEEDEVDYTEMTVKELKAEAKDRGIRVTKGMKRSALVKALEADDEE